jgi:hypothetical protein
VGLEHVLQSPPGNCGVLLSSNGKASSTQYLVITGNLGFHERAHALNNREFILTNCHRAYRSRRRAIRKGCNLPSTVTRHTRA